MVLPTPEAIPPGRLTRWPFFYGWIVVAVAFVTMAIGANTRTAFSLLFPPLLAEFGWERGVTAAAFSIGFISATLYAPFIGLLMDRFGPRYVVSFGVLLVSIGIATATRIQQPWHLYLTLGVLVVGGSVFMTYIGHSIFLPNWFVRKRGLAIGIAFSGVGVGSILLFPWLQYIIDHVGWRQACWVMAILLCAVLIPLNVLLQRQRPQDMGLAPDGDAVSNAIGTGEAIPRNVVDPKWVAIEWTLGRSVRTTRFWWVFGGFFCGLHAWYAVQVHQTKYLIEMGFGPTQAAYALGWVGLTGIVGQIALGYLSDRVGREWAWTASGLGFMVCYALLLLLPQYPTSITLYLIVGSQGVLGYGLTSVMGAIPAELFQGKRYGAIFGVLSLAIGLGAASGPWITGMLYDQFGSYTQAWWLALGLSAVSVLCMWFAAPRRVRAVAGQVGRLQTRQP